METAAGTGTSPIETRGLRPLAVGMLGVAAVWPVLPVHPPFACPLRAATGIPCPLCGMTRSVVAAVHGHLMTSLTFNPAGILVVLAAVLLVVLRPRRIVIRGPWLLVAFAALWVWNVGFNPTFH